MGTRHLSIVIQGEKPVISQYGQWDGYPSGQGIKFFRFLKSMDKEKFSNQLKKCSFITEEQENIKREQIKRITANKKTGSEQVDEFNKLYPYFNRDHGAEILSIVYDSPETETNILLEDSFNFASDSLWCEWAYVIDLDKNTFEVYEGFNTRKLGKTQRFYDLQEEMAKQNKLYTSTDANGKDITYYPVRRKKIFNLDELPETEDDFLNAVGVKF